MPFAHQSGAGRWGFGDRGLGLRYRSVTAIGFHKAAQLAAQGGGGAAIGLRLHMISGGVFEQATAETLRWWFPVGLCPQLDQFRPGKFRNRGEAFRYGLWTASTQHGS